MTTCIFFSPDLFFDCLRFLILIFCFNFFFLDCVLFLNCSCDFDLIYFFTKTRKKLRKKLYVVDMIVSFYLRGI